MPDSSAAVAWVEGAEFEERGNFETLVDALRRNAIELPDTKIECTHASGERTSLSYATLFDLAQRCAAELQRLGLRAGDPVVLHIKDTAEFLPVFWGCLLGGFVAVPTSVGITYDPDEGNVRKLKNMWTLLGEPPVVTESGYRGRLESLTATMAMSRLRIAHTEELRTSKATYNPHAPAAADPALILQTSGSTGAPKAIVQPHSNLVFRTRSANSVLPVRPDDTSFNWMPIENGGGLVFFHIRDVIAGCHQVHVPTELILQDPLLWLDLLHAHKVNLTWAPNFAYGLVNERIEREGPRDWDLCKLRLLLSAGEMVVPATMQRFLANLEPFGLRPEAFVPAWGMSELCTTVTYSDRFSAQLGLNSGPFTDCGRPIPGVALRVVGSDDGMLRESEVGRVQVRGPCVLPEYFKNPAANRDAFASDGWFTTGDLGFLRDGRLTLTGREKDLIIVNGENFHSHEIEAAVEELSAVKTSFTAAVAVRSDGQTREKTDELAVFFCVDEATQVSLKETLRSIRNKVVKVGINPRFLVPVDESVIPKTAMGKIQRSELRHRFEAGEFESVVTATDRTIRDASEGPVAVRSEIQQRISQIWRDVLQLAAEPSLHANLFDLGGSSILLPEILRRVQDDTAADVQLVDLLEHPTIAALASHIVGSDDPHAGPRKPSHRAARQPTEAIAVVGIAGRFPGAESIEQFWDNLWECRETITFFTEDELRAAGVAAEHLAMRGYVKAKPMIDGVDLFDAEFFGISPYDAKLIDPQQRVFLECCWHALEDAGYDPDRCVGPVGVFGGCLPSSYLHYNLNRPAPHTTRQGSDLLAFIGNASDSMPTRVSYELGLRGPAVSVQTHCSTSLVAIHYACRSLVDMECDMAIAGGVAVQLPHATGYLHAEGGILARDGHCRPFARAASGTVMGEGVGVVVLKRLSDALRDGDNIWAVVKGSAVNNDGRGKVAFTAPSQAGQVDVLRRAHENAGVDASSITYVEAHATGTKLGDPIELRALQQVFGDAGAPQNGCSLGSLKGNIGHLETASGVAGFIKACLALHHRKLPGVVHCDELTPEFDFPRSTFSVSPDSRAWDADVRRAGVSSFGVGGTNAHVVLEEAPAVAGEHAKDRWQLIVLSARNTAGLEQSRRRLADWIADREICLSDVAATLALGRRQLPHRLSFACETPQQLRDTLTGQGAFEPDRSVATPGGEPRIAFSFPGVGSQYVNMGRDLYETEPEYRKHLDACAELLKTGAPDDPGLLQILYPEPGQEEQSRRLLLDTRVMMPAIFSTSYALAQTLIAWGIKPSCLIGHSLGEYVAACLAGVFSVADGLRIVAERGRLIQTTAEGGMVAVEASPAAIRPLLGDELTIAVENGPTALVVSGPAAAVDNLVEHLEGKSIAAKRIHSKFAAHSVLVEPVMAEFSGVVGTATLSAPSIPYVSNVTGRWQTTEQATNPNYWSAHLRASVDFSRGVETLLDAVDVIVEVGPGTNLTGLVSRHPACRREIKKFHTLPHPSADSTASAVLLRTLGRLWGTGARVEWSALHRSAPTRRARLPGYPFQRKPFWIDGAGSVAVRRASQESIACRPHAESPRGATAERLTALWSDVLGVEDIGPDDSYFELGGTSLGALTLCELVSNELGHAMTPGDLMRSPTIAQLARLIDGSESESQTTRVVVLSERDGPAPLFLAPDFSGSPLHFVEMAKRWSSERGLYAFQAPGLDPSSDPLSSIEDIAREFLGAVRQIQPQGPYHFGGWSLGGLVAYEMAHQVQAAGEEIALLVAFDSAFRIDLAAIDDPFPAFAELDAARRKPSTAPFAVNYGEFYSRISEICLLMGIRLKSPAELTELDPVDRLRHLLQVADQIRPLGDYFSCTHRALTTYRPKQLAADLVWLSANEVGSHDFKSRPAKYAWSDWVQGELLEIEVPGDHVTMLAEPNVATVVKHLNEQLQRTRSAVSVSHQ